MRPCELAVVGDFDPAEIGKVAGELFADWRSATAYKRVSSPHFDIAPIIQTFETPDKANAFFFARLNLKMRNDNPDFPAFSMGNFILGGGFLNSRLATRIRQKEGLSYGVGSGFNASATDESGTFFGKAIYARRMSISLKRLSRKRYKRSSPMALQPTRSSRQRKAGFSTGGGVAERTAPSPTRCLPFFSSTGRSRGRMSLIERSQPLHRRM